MEAVFTGLGFPKYVRYFDSGETLVRYGVKYNSKTLTTTFPAAFVEGLTIKNNNATFNPFIIGSSKKIRAGNLNFSSSVYFDDVFNSKARPTLTIDEGKFAINTSGCSEYFAVFDENMKMIGKPSDNFGNNYNVGGFVLKLSDGSLLSVANRNYYDKCYFFARYKDNMQTVHNYKTSVSYTNYKFIAYESGNVYVFALGMNSYGRTIVYKYSEGSQSITTMLDKNGSNKVATFIPSDFVENNGKYYAFQFLPKDTNALTYGAVVWDKEQDTFVYEEWSVDYGSVAESEVVSLPASDRRQGFVLFTTTDSQGKLYLNLVSLTRDDYSLDTSYHRIITYEVDFANKKLTYKNHKLFNDKVMTVSFISPDRKMIALEGSSNFFVLQFLDGGLWNFNSLVVSTTYDYLDAYGRFWVEDNNGSLYYLSKKGATLVISKLEQSYYDYTGDPIDTNLLIDVFNYLGERISVNATINIISKEVLQFSDGSYTKTVTTSADDITKVPVKIIGGGYPVWQITINID